jgi:hypothetical protein
MCQREGLSLQAGMNFGVGGNHSVILMSVRPNAPYRDRIEDGGTTLIYEGHDQPRVAGLANPKSVDQLDTLPSGGLTQNGKFHRAAHETKAGRRRPERVRVYEKIKPASGATTASSTWSIRGPSVTRIGWFTSSDSKRLRVRRTSRYRHQTDRLHDASSRRP